MTDPLRILIVEDEALLAMDLEMTIEECGHVVAGEAVCLRSAEALAENLKPDLALVDVQLAHGTSGLDVSQMIQHRWPQTVIVFVTANPSRVPADFGGAHGLLTKPFSRQGLQDTFSYLTQGIFDPPPQQSRPEVLSLSKQKAREWNVAL